MSRRWSLPLLLALAIAWSLLLLPHSAAAQAQVVDLQAEYAFGEWIDFSGRLQSEQPVQKAQLFFQAEGSNATQIDQAQVLPDGRLLVHYELDQNPIRAFSRIDFWFELTLIGGEEYKSPTASLYYEDNRFDWQSREASSFRVHWYEGDSAFAQNLLDVAGLGLSNARTLLPFSLKEKVDLYAYASAADMRTALQTMGKNWIGAHTDPDLSVMVVSLPPGPEQRLEMERQIPHELMHILLYQNIGAGYVNLPVWLNEGLASVAELYPNPDYMVLLQSAYQRDSLLSIQSLCQTFPRDASSAFLAYAEAASFTRYLHQKFGLSGVEALVRGYAQGLDCDRGAEVALQAPLSRLERQWRQDVFGENASLVALTNLLPWFGLLLAVLLAPIVLTVASLRKKSRRGEAWTMKN